MKLASLAFVVVLIIAHMAGDRAETLALPLSMFRDEPYCYFGYTLFGLLLLIAGLMIFRLHRVKRDIDAVLLGVVTLFLVLVAVTPSWDVFHGLCAFVAIGLLFGYYAAVFHGEGRLWLWLHLALPIVALIATQFHSYGLWQKSVIVYFVLLVNIQAWLAARGRGVLDVPRYERSPGTQRQRTHVIEAERKWSRKSGR